MSQFQTASKTWYGFWKWGKWHNQHWFIQLSFVDTQMHVCLCPFSVLIYYFQWTYSQPAANHNNSIWNTFNVPNKILYSVCDLDCIANRSNWIFQMFRLHYNYMYLSPTHKDIYWSINNTANTKYTISNAIKRRIMENWNKDLAT